MPNILKTSLAAMAAALAIGVSSSAFAWSVEGKVDIVVLAPGAYNGAANFIYVAPITALPTFRWLTVNRLDRCNDLASDALGDDSTVVLSGAGACSTTGTIRRCPGVVTRCSVYRNR
jgi:hypothetical protein